VVKEHSIVAFGKQAIRTLSRLGIILAVAIAFLTGLAGTVYLSLRSPEVKVPDVVGKDMVSGEALLNDSGLNIRKRASRYSPEARPNTILDQSPRPGEVVKEGQTVAVVVSRAPTEAEAAALPPKARATPSPKSEATESQDTSDEQENTNKNKNVNRNRNTNNANNANIPNGNRNMGNSNLNRNAAAPNVNGAANSPARTVTNTPVRPVINGNANRAVPNLNNNRRPANVPTTTRPSGNLRVP
jgi:hypothetical protein